MYASIFSYDISRPYPFRWFTPVVIVGGLLATTLITFLSVATQGYQMAAVSLTNPNDTDSAQTLFTRWPSYLTANTRSTCSSTNLPVGTEFYTNNTALSYILSSIEHGSDEGGEPSLLGSLPYHNNPIENCTVDQITITFAGMERTALQIARRQWGATLGADISCSVSTSDGSMNISLITAYDINPSETTGGLSLAQFPVQNKTARPSLWWGQSLLGWYSANLTNQMHLANAEFVNDNNSAVYKGYVTFSRAEMDTPDAAGIESQGFFNVTCFFMPFSDDGNEQIYYCSTPIIHRLANKTDPDSILPQIWQAADSVAKSFHYTVLADLGQSGPGPNIFADADLLAYFSKNITAIKQSPGYKADSVGLGGLATEPFDPADASAVRLGISPSVIATSYFCQVPQLKSTPALIVSVLINAIVLLSTLWKAFKLIIDWFLIRKYPELKVCEGCLPDVDPVEKPLISSSDD